MSQIGNKFLDYSESAFALTFRDTEEIQTNNSALKGRYLNRYYEIHFEIKIEEAYYYFIVSVVRGRRVRDSSSSYTFLCYLV